MSQKYPYPNTGDEFLSQDMYADSYQTQSNTYRPRVRSSFQEQNRSTPSSSRTADSSVLMPGMALSFLNSCGLDSSDIAHLAELPEHLFTGETLPKLLLEIKERKLSSASSSMPSTSQPLDDTSTHAWEGSDDTQPVEYPIDRPTHPVYPLPPEQVQTWQDRWGNPRRSSTTDTTRSSSKSSNVPDYTCSKNTGPYRDTTKSPEASSRSLPDSRPRPLLSLKLDPPVVRPTRKEASDFDCKVPPEFPHVCFLCHISVHSTKEWFFHVRGREHTERQLEHERRYPKWDQTLEAAKRNESSEVYKVPTRKEASDFIGAVPQDFPCLCVLCNIAVFSKKDWSVHVTSGQHAKSQLDLMEKYPEWDGTVRSARRNDGPTSTDAQDGSSKESTSDVKMSQGKDEAKVVCVKFESSTVEERYLRKLVGQFGDAVRVGMFPRMAYVEMESKDQAEDVVKYFAGNPLKVQEKPVEFSVCVDFVYPQPSSRVVSFTPLPGGDGISSELTAIAKRFGSIKKSLFLPNRGYVEMTSFSEAQKLVEHYSASQLKLKGKIVQISYSCEYNSLRDADVKDRTQSRSSRSHRRSSPSRHSIQRDSPSPRRRRSSERTRSSPKRRSSSERTHSSPKRRRSSDRSQCSRSRYIKEREVSQKSKQRASTDEKGSVSKNYVKSMDSDSDIEGLQVMADDGEKLVHGIDDYESTTCDQVNLPSEPMDVTDVHREKQEKTGEKRPNADKSEASNSLKEGQRFEHHENQEIEEEDHDFPQTLENCVTLDEFMDENLSESDNPKASIPKTEGFDKLIPTSDAEKVAADSKNQDVPHSNIPKEGEHSEKQEESQSSSIAKTTTLKEEEPPSKSKDEKPSEEKDPCIQEVMEKKVSEKKEQKVESNTDVPPTEPSSGALTAICEKSQEPTEAPTPSTESVKKPETTTDALGSYQPNIPVGVEFLKMGYYCRVCLVFYSNEDTAKKVHCSSQAHYEKLKKHLEKEKAKAQGNREKN